MLPALTSSSLSMASPSPRAPRSAFPQERTPNTPHFSCRPGCQHPGQGPSFSLLWGLFGDQVETLSWHQPAASCHLNLSSTSQDFSAIKRVCEC